jgi:zinc transporter
MEIGVEIAAGRLDTAMPTAGAPPGLVLAFRFFTNGRIQELPVGRALDLSASEASWLWLHFNLADKRACQWIGVLATVPAGARALLVAPQDHQQLYATNDCIYGVFSDLVRALEGAVEQMAYLTFAMTERVVVTGRRQPLQAVEAVRAALGAGRHLATPAGLVEALVEQAVSGIDRLLDLLAKQLDQVEDLLLIDSVNDERRSVARVRRTGVRLHRQIASLRVLLRRFDVSDDIALSPAITLNTDRLAQRLDALDQEVVALEARARLLQDEVSARLSEESARNLNALSILTALFLPATLVTGIFGMNTGGLPLAHSIYGSAWAVGLGLAAAGLTYWLLRRMGVIRR